MPSLKNIYIFLDRKLQITVPSSSTECNMIKGREEKNEGSLEKCQHLKAKAENHYQMHTTFVLLYKLRNAETSPTLLNTMMLLSEEPEDFLCVCTVNAKMCKFCATFENSATFLETELKFVTLTRLRYSATAERAAAESFLAASSHTQQCTPLLPE